MSHIMNRRLGVMSVLAGLISASCTVPYAQRLARGRLSFYEALSVLQSVETVAEFEQAINLTGGSIGRSQLGPADPRMSISAYFDDNRIVSDRDNSYWERLFAFSRTDLPQAIEVGTRMSAYGYQFNQPMNPTSGMLFVFADDNDRVIGWMYSKTLVGNEREAMPG